MNILAVDVGNSRIALAACRDGKLAEVRHVDHSAIDLQLPSAVRELVATIAPRPAPRVVVASVNPAVSDAVVESIGQIVDWPVLHVGREIELPIEVALPEPEKVGVDRVLASAVAFEEVGGPVVVACFGTALTVNCVDAAGRFLGGTISPGVGISARLLHESTAFLPEVTSAEPAGPFGQNTAEAIQAGLFYMAGGTIREVVERMADQLGQWPHLVLTGGDAELIAKAYEFVDSLVPDLVLRGVNLAFHKHVERTGKR